MVNGLDKNGYQKLDYNEPAHIPGWESRLALPSVLILLPVGGAFRSNADGYSGHGIWSLRLDTRIVSHNFYRVINHQIHE